MYFHCVLLGTGVQKDCKRLVKKNAATSGVQAFVVTTKLLSGSKSGVFQGFWWSSAVWRNMFFGVKSVCLKAFLV